MENAAVVRSLEYRLDAAKAVLAKFAEGFAKDPLYALSWGQDVYEAAAWNSIAGGLIKDMPAEGAAEKILELAQREVFQAARSPASSTSATSNLAKQAEAQVWAKVYEMFSWE
jgi:hypothetical protein